MGCLYAQDVYVEYVLTVGDLTRQDVGTKMLIVLCAETKISSSIY